MTVFGPPTGAPSPETVASVKRKANARLIAAAPEMRNLLERICETMVCQGTWYESEARALLARLSGDSQTKVEGNNA